MPISDLRSHMDRCADCRSWQASAQAVGSELRHGVDETPDLVERVLTAAASAPAQPRPALASASVLAVALAFSAVAQLIVAVPILLAGSGDAGHHGREIASFDIALAVGFLLAAWRPARAVALVPVAVVLSLCLFLTGMVDVVNDAAALPGEAGHLVVVVQAAALWVLARSGHRWQEAHA